VRDAQFAHRAAIRACVSMRIEVGGNFFDLQFIERFTCMAV
jgi:hypothetical protein